MLISTRACARADKHTNAVAKTGRAPDAQARCPTSLFTHYAGTLSLPPEPDYVRLRSGSGKGSQPAPKFTHVCEIA
jgi:hypothetical protein